MNRVFEEEERFEEVDFTIEGLPKGDYEACHFVRCVFSKLFLGQVNFAECAFEHCDFSMTNLANTTLREVEFKDCKLLGTRFEGCNRFLLKMDFRNCQMNLSSFNQLQLKQTHFKDCSLREVDFSETDLTQSVFDNCDFLGVTFDRTILEKADFRTSFHISLDPDNNQIRGAKFSAANVMGLLDKYGIEVS